MHIWVDADACPAVIKDILFRAAERTRRSMTLVANKMLRTPPSRYIRALQVPRGIDVADSHIVRELKPGDLVITADIPLAADVIAKGAHALNPRGEFYTTETIQERLALRNYLDELRGTGVRTGGPEALGNVERKRFADQLDRFLAKVGKGEAVGLEEESMRSRIGAAVLRRFGAALEVPDLPGLEALSVLNERSVCRRYSAKPVPEEVLRLLCASALSAPTKSDLQQATIVRVADAAKRSAICSLLPGSPWLARAPELLVFCADGYRLRRLFARRGVVFPNEHLDAFFNAAVDAALVLGAFVSAAELAGLGSCPISQVRDHVGKVDELLGLPEWVVPVAGLALGYPEAKEALSARLALSATVHTDRYDREAVERELGAYDARRGKEWSGDKVKQYSKVMRGDFGEHVRRKRFCLD